MPEMYKIIHVMNLENKLLAKSSSVPGSSNRKTIASDCKNIVVRVSKQHLQRRLLFEIACLPSRFQNRLFPILSIPSVILEVSPGMHHARILLIALR